jgi:hypothetical protein
MFAALNQCHRIGDIKPENVLLVPGSDALIIGLPDVSKMM